MRRSAAAALAVLGGLLALGVLLAGPASAHATVVGSDPADGSRLSSAPRSVTITFDEAVGVTGVGYLHVTDGNGKRVDAGPATHPAGDATRVTDALVSGLGDGTYTASFRVVSADSHPVAGTIRFVVGDGALVRGSTGVSSGDASVADLLDAVRWVSYAGLALLGGGWLVLTVWPAGRDDLRARRLVWTGWGAAAVGAALEVLLQGPYSAGVGPSHLLDASLVDATLHSDYGQWHSARLVLLGVVALVLARSLQADARPARWEAVAGVAGLGIVWTFAATGHATTTSPSWLSVPLDVAHLTAMAVWLGGLVMLLAGVLPRRERDELSTVLPVFSRAAFTAVAVLAVTGTYAAWRGIGSLHALFGTTYGLLVVGKVVLFIGLLALGNLSRRLVNRRAIAYAMTDAAVLDEPAPDTVPADAERLRRSVLVEVAVGALVLALTAVLVAQPRGAEALAADDRAPVTAHAPLTSTRSLMITADPGVHGNVTLTVDLSGGPAPKSVTATATLPSRQLGPLPVKLTRATAGVYDGTVELPVAGRWRIDLDVTLSALDAVTTGATLSLH